MSELRFTDTNAGDDSTGRVFGLDGNLYLPLVIGLVAGILLFGGLGLLGAGYSLAGSVGAVPIAGSAIWVLGFRQGKPAGYDRDRLATGDGVFARFLPNPKAAPTPGTVYLVCTSAGEVGVDISADHLVCDLSTYESMAQRFGRVNRRGGIDPGQ